MSQSLAGSVSRYMWAAGRRSACAVLGSGSLVAQPDGKTQAMRQLLAAIVLGGCLVCLAKLGGKGLPTPLPKPAHEPRTHPGNSRDSNSIGQTLQAKYPNQRALLDRVLPKYRRTAIEVEAAHGVRGLKLLDSLDLEAVFLFEKYPREFQQLAASLNDQAAADLLVHWREYLGWKQENESDRGRIIAEISHLPTTARRAAGRFPQALPLILAEPVGITDLIERLGHEPAELEQAIELLQAVSLEHGPADLKLALQTLDLHRELAVRAFGLMGPEGFALVTLYGPIFDAVGDTVPLEHSLLTLGCNSDDLDILLQSHAASELGRELRHLSSLGLLDEAASSPHGLRLAVEFGAAGDRALSSAGPDAADLVYSEFADPRLRQRAVEALGEHGPMALAMLSKYATDPDFQQILVRDGGAIIPPIARADVGPEVLLLLQQNPAKTFTESLAQRVLNLSGENGQATIRLIKKDGLSRVSELNRTDVPMATFLPLYDLLHLGGVITRGNTPTSGELVWAMLDAGFIAWDVATLAAAQPEATVAGEVARSELRSTTRQIAGTAGRSTLERVAGRSMRLSARASLASAELVQRAAVPLNRLAGPLCRKAGLRLSTWEPITLVKDGASLLLRIPPDRWAKYAGVSLAQAGVGVVAMRKMEEHLLSPPTTQP